MNPRAAPPAQPAGTYSVAENEALLAQSKTATNNHLVAAADYITRLFEANQVPFAIMGGFSMNIRGSIRETYDVDVAVGCDMNKLLAVVSASGHRILRPLGPASGVLRLYVKVGGEYDEELSSKYVMVDVLLRGSLGAPDEIENEVEDMTAMTSRGERRYRLLSLRALLQAKLGAVFGRDGVSDMEDLRWLIQMKPEDVYNVRAALKQEQRQYFINKLAATEGVMKGELAKARHVLAVAESLPVGGKIQTKVTA